MNLNFGQLRQLLLPSILRRSVLLNAMLSAILYPIESMYNVWRSYEEQERRERTYNSQVQNLRRALADRLHTDYDNILIYDVEDKEHLYIYKQADNRDVMLLDAIYIYSENDIRYSRGFTVSIPSEYMSKVDEVRAVLDRYKMVTSRYYINWI